MHVQAMSVHIENGGCNCMLPYVCLLDCKTTSTPAGIEDADPYWVRAWPSSIALASLILARPELVAGKKVADVGCGLGLAGLAAALAGAAAANSVYQRHRFRCM